MSSQSLQQHPLVILGAGYTGLRVYQQALESGWRVFATSRNPQINLTHLPKEHRILFDLTLPETWENIPNPSHLIWCFPGIPTDQIKKFLSTRSPQHGRLLLLGSTSAYEPDGQPVTEGTPLKIQLPRVQTEEYLRINCGAVIIRLAGLYGPGRHVYDWIRKGKIQNTSKWVNLLHVEDAAAISLLALTKAPDSNTYLASDGHPRTWKEICSMAASRYQIPIPHPTPTQHLGKQVSIDKLQTDLGYQFRFPDLYVALDLLERGKI